MYFNHLPSLKLWQGKRKSQKNTEIVIISRTVIIALEGPIVRRLHPRIILFTPSLMGLAFYLKKTVFLAVRAVDIFYILRGGLCFVLLLLCKELKMVLRHCLKLKTVIIVLLLGILVGPVYAGRRDRQMSTKTLRSMARAYMAFGKYEKAHSFAAKALRQGCSQKTDTGEMALCLIDMGTVCSYEGLLTQARRRLEEGVELQKKALFDDHPYVAHTLRMLSDVCLRQGDLVQAETVLSQAVGIMLNHCDLQSKEMAPFILESANLQFEKGELDQAQDNYQTALDIYEQSYGSQHLMTANVLKKMARLHIVRNDAEEATQLMSQSLKIKTRIYGRYHPQLIDGWLAMARLYKQQGQTARCEYYLAKSTETVSNTRNAVTMARVYEQVNQIRKQGLVASAIAIN
ncbi:MAG: tetratricopeptide repeat protein [Planctomycetes bacterium]|nr:tetratricopeptide repeat protein [Planctomycetota bacterium]